MLISVFCAMQKAHSDKPTENYHPALHTKMFCGAFLHLSVHDDGILKDLKDMYSL